MFRYTYKCIYLFLVVYIYIYDLDIRSGFSGCARKEDVKLCHEWVLVWHENVIRIHKRKGYVGGEKDTLGR